MTFKTVTALLAAGVALWAQAPRDFEVASVKPFAAGGGGMLRGGPGTEDPGHFEFSGGTLAGLIGMAYGVGGDQVSGPAWLNTERYAVTANVPSGATREEFSGMLQRLLTARFGLAFHREQKVADGYELTIIKSGVRFKETPEKAGEVNTPSVQGQFGANGAHLTYQHITMKFLASDLMFRLRTMNRGPMGDVFRVADKTGLTGSYGFTLEYLRPTDTEAVGVDLFAALQSQLGLRLDPVKMPIEMLVVDRADRVPAEN